MSAVETDARRLDDLARRLCRKPLLECGASELVTLTHYLEALATDQQAIVARAEAALAELEACGGPDCGIRIPQLPGGGDDPTRLRVRHACGRTSSLSSSEGSGKGPHSARTPGGDPSAAVTGTQQVSTP